MTKSWLTAFIKSPLRLTPTALSSLSIFTRNFKTTTDAFAVDRGSDSLEPTAGGYYSSSKQSVNSKQGDDFQREGTLSDGEFMENPMMYYFTKVKPDLSACLISDESKENIWSLHKSDPEIWTVDKLAEEYKIRKQRVHAILWLKDLEREAEKKNGGPLDDSIQKNFEQFYGSHKKAEGEKHVKIYFTNPEGLDDDSEEYKTKLLEASEKEERYKVLEFVQRMEYVKQKMDGLILNKKNRKRPEGGWKYVVEDLSESGKRGKGGGRRFIANSKGEQRELNDFEKSFLQRERVLPRRRLVPR